MNAVSDPLEQRQRTVRANLDTLLQGIDRIVVERLVDGKHPVTIAQELSMNPAAVTRIKRRLFERFNAHSILELKFWYRGYDDFLSQVIGRMGLGPHAIYALLVAGSGPDGQLKEAQNYLGSKLRQTDQLVLDEMFRLLENLGIICLTKGQHLIHIAPNLRTAISQVMADLSAEERYRRLRKLQDIDVWYEQLQRNLASLISAVASAEPY